MSFGMSIKEKLFTFNLTLPEKLKFDIPGCEVLYRYR